jgi:hypothetical protein
MQLSIYFVARLQDLLHVGAHLDIVTVTKFVDIPFLRGQPHTCCMCLTSKHVPWQNGGVYSLWTTQWCMLSGLCVQLQCGCLVLSC